VSEAGDIDLREVFGTTHYATRHPRPKTFKPWHRPRKHFVRTMHWEKAIASLIDDGGLRDGTLRYLGLPGSDLLDIRHFDAACCRGRNLQLLFLGFNSAATPGSDEQLELAIAMDEVRKSASVHPLSDVLPDDIAQLGNVSSIAWKRAVDLGPFDVVNFDLCDGIAKRPVGAAKQNQYEAVASIFDLQARRVSPWLFLLTTRVGRSHIEAGVSERLRERVDDNLRNCSAFRDAVDRHLGSAIVRDIRAAWKRDALLSSLASVGVVKWLLAIAAAQSPSTRGGLESVSAYTVRRGAVAPDMVSLCLRFEPNLGGRKDPMGLATGTGVLVDECSQAAAAFDAITQWVDVDVLLSSDAALQEELTDSKALLLETARYDANAYRTWLAGQRE
jgi:hypothetical protein